MPGAPPDAAFIRANAIVDPFGEGLALERAHSHVFGSAQFDAREGADARFSAVRHTGHVVPVLYAGEDRHAAASETIFHTVDGAAGSHRPRRVYLSKYSTWQWSTVVTARDVLLVRLDGDGLVNLGTTRAELVAGDRSTYASTRAWAEALLAALPDVDGFWWMSRQAPSLRAFAVYERVTGRAGGMTSGRLEGSGPALPFASPPGREALYAIATEFDITVLGP